MLFSGRFTLWAVPLLLALASTSGLAAGDEFADIVARITPSVVGVGAAYPRRVPTAGRAPQRLLGSGFAVAYKNRNLIVTNDHVIAADLRVEEQESLAVFSGSGGRAETRFARALARDEEHDLALLEYDGLPLPTMTLGGSQAVRAGVRVAFTGFPIGAVLGLYPATHQGIVSAVTPIARPANRGRDLSSAEVRRLRSPFNVYQLDAIAYPGNSGSAVYSAQTGEVIGVMNSVFVKESRESLLSAPSGIAYAIPVEHLHSLLAQLP